MKCATTAIPCTLSALRPTSRLAQRSTATNSVLPLNKHSFLGLPLQITTTLRSSPLTVTAAEPSDRPSSSSSNSSGGDVKYSTEFGYSRKDVILIGVGLIAFGYILYYGLQAQGMDAGMAGNWVQLLIFLGICVGWIGSYLFRVANKQMTYVKQLEEYEEAVMKKRLEEMPEAELEQVMADIEAEKAARNQQQQK